MLDSIKQFFSDHIETSQSDDSNESGQAINIAAAALLIEVGRADFDFSEIEQARIAVLLREEDGPRLRLVMADTKVGGGPQLSSSFSEFLSAALANREFIYVEDMSSLLDEFPKDRERQTPLTFRRCT